MNLERILREVLAKDKSILCRRDELIAELERRVPGNLRRDFAPIKKALSLNIGEKFFVGEADKNATKQEAAEILKSSGMQAARIDFVIETFAAALDWYKPLIPAESSTLEENFTAPEESVHASKVNTVKAAHAESEEIFTAPEESVYVSKVNTVKAAHVEPEEIFTAPEPEPIKHEEPVSQESSRVKEARPQNDYRQENSPTVQHNDKGKIFTLTGRLNRLAYFLQTLKIVGIMFIGGLFDAGKHETIGILIFLVALIGSCAISVRRLHDLDKSGWWLLVSFIPYIDIVFGLYLLFAPGTKGYNRYGADPLTE